LCSGYIDTWVDYINRDNRTVKIEFLLNNSGSSPADDIDLFFHIPDGCEVISDVEKEPSLPKIPEKPISRLNELVSFFNAPNLSDHLNYFPNINNNFGILKKNVSDPRIKKTNSYVINVHVERLKHDNIVELAPVFFLFDSLDSASSFSIDCKINAANFPNTIETKLQFILEKNTETKTEKNLDYLCNILIN
jgi:hypothetical protein